jgi:hypothetical protein
VVTQVSAAAIRRGVSKVGLILAQKSRKWETITPTRQLIRRVDTVRNKRDRVYDQHVCRIADMLRFCYLVQDYESAVVFDRVRTPNNPPPPDADLVKSYLNYKCSTTDTPLMHKGKIVRDCGTGTDIFCQAAWHCPTNVSKTFTTIKALQSLHSNLVGDYIEACPACLDVDNEIEEQWKANGCHGSCETHASQPRLRKRGDVTTEPNVIAQFKNWRTAMQAGHMRKGNAALCPSEVRKLRRVLVGSGNRDNFKWYTMILVGIKLFLRSDELLCLTVEQFCTKMAQVDPEGVRSLAAWIQGKSDNAPILLNIYSDPNDFEFDLLHHLLVYVKTFDIQNGLLFPDSSGGEISYETFRRKLGSLLRNVLGKPETCMAGTHTLRKTAYLFAVYGCLFYFGWQDENSKYCTAVLCLLTTD